MKIKHLMLLAALISVTGLTRNAVAYGDESHVQSVESPANQKGVSINSPEAALKALQDSVSFMDEAVNKNQKDLFNDGKTMELFHAKLVSVGDATAYLEKYAETLDEQKKPHLVSAMQQVSNAIADLHMATHDKNLEKTVSGLKQTKDAIKQLEISLK